MINYNKLIQKLKDKGTTTYIIRQKIDSTRSTYENEK